MRRGNFIAFTIALGCCLLHVPSALAQDAAPRRIITDRNGVVLDSTLPALAYLRPDKMAGDQPLRLSLDTKSGRILDEELAAAVEKYSAKGAAGFIMDVNTGEIIALSSIEGRNSQPQAASIGSLPPNRVTQAVYEFGSSAKLMTIAMALDAGKADLTSRIDGRELHYGRYTIHDQGPQRRVLTLSDAVKYSSNIASARLAQRVGTAGQKAFLEKMSQLDRLEVEGIEEAAPIHSKDWPAVYTLVASFGHGMAVSPLQAGMAVAALVNGGTLVRPTILERSDQGSAAAGPRVVSSETSETMRHLIRLNAEEGTGLKANVAGYFVGGVTSTAEKVVNEQYARDKVITSFIAVFPADKPKYLVMALLDEPQALRETFGFRLAGWNATAVAAKVIERAAPILGIERRAMSPASRIGLRERGQGVVGQDG